MRGGIANLTGDSGRAPTGGAAAAADLGSVPHTKVGSTPGSAIAAAAVSPKVVSVAGNSGPFLCRWGSCTDTFDSKQRLLSHVEGYHIFDDPATKILYVVSADQPQKHGDAHRPVAAVPTPRPGLKRPADAARLSYDGGDDETDDEPGAPHGPGQRKQQHPQKRPVTGGLGKSSAQQKLKNVSSSGPVKPSVAELSHPVCTGATGKQVQAHQLEQCGELTQPGQQPSAEDGDINIANREDRFGRSSPSPDSGPQKLQKASSASAGKEPSDGKSQRGTTPPLTNTTATDKQIPRAVTARQSPATIASRPITAAATPTVNNAAADMQIESAAPTRRSPAAADSFSTAAPVLSAATRTLSRSQVPSSVLPSQPPQTTGVHGRVPGAQAVTPNSQVQNPQLLEFRARVGSAPPTDSSSGAATTSSVARPPLLSSIGRPASSVTLKVPASSPSNPFVHSTHPLAMETTSVSTSATVYGASQTGQAAGCWISAHFDNLFEAVPPLKTFFASELARIRSSNEPAKAQQDAFQKLCLLVTRLAQQVEQQTNQYLSLLSPAERLQKMSNKVRLQQHYLQQAVAQQQQQSEQALAPAATVSVGLASRSAPFLASAHIQAMRRQQQHQQYHQQHQLMLQHQQQQQALQQQLQPQRAHYNRPQAVQQLQLQGVVNSTSVGQSSAQMHYLSPPTHVRQPVTQRMPGTTPATSIAMTARHPTAISDVALMSVTASPPAAPLAKFAPAAIAAQARRSSDSIADACEGCHAQCDSPYSVCDSCLNPYHVTCHDPPPPVPQPPTLVSATAPRQLAPWSRWVCRKCTEVRASLQRAADSPQPLSNSLPASSAMFAAAGTRASRATPTGT